MPGFNATSELEYENNWEVVYELLNLSHPSDGGRGCKVGHILSLQSHNNNNKLSSAVAAAVKLS